jgi:23S rRNA (adenine2503-C2)-methyltransferase
VSPDAPPLRLLDLPLVEARAALQEVLRDLGGPAWRADQILKQVHGRAVRRFEDMTDLPLALRPALSQRVLIGTLDLAHRAQASDGTIKHLWRLRDGEEIESVAIPRPGHWSICVSTQAGCALHCRFCATGRLGLRRNLTSGEIVDQILATLEDLGDAVEPGLSIIFMGMGEPGYNLANVLASCRLLNDPQGLGVGARHMTISTAGVVPAIRAIAAEPLQVRLAVSLHAADQALRASLMDIADRYSIDDLRDACIEYHYTTGRRVTLEWAVMAGINDRPDDAAALATFARAVGAKVNLIPYNPVEGFEAAATSERTASRFRDLLRSCFDGSVMVRRTRGRDIEAACGMLHRARSEGRQGARA